jgi:hypothetical protein
MIHLRAMTQAAIFYFHRGGGGGEAQSQASLLFLEVKMCRSDFTRSKWC